jgi:hypothetical protein
MSASHHLSPGQFGEPGSMYRGMLLGMPAERARRALDPSAAPHERAAVVLEHLNAPASYGGGHDREGASGTTGVHWSASEKTAAGFGRFHDMPGYSGPTYNLAERSAEHERLGLAPDVGVVLHAEVPPASRQMTSARSRRADESDYPQESEIRMRRGGAVNVTGMTLRGPWGQGPDEYVPLRARLKA